MISTEYSIVSQTCMSIVSQYKPVKGCWHTLILPVCLQTKTEQPLIMQNVLLYMTLQGIIEVEINGIDARIDIQLPF